MSSRFSCFKMQCDYTRSTDLTAVTPVKDGAENILEFLGNICILVAKVFLGKILIYLGKFANNVEATLPQTNGACRVLPRENPSRLLSNFIINLQDDTRHKELLKYFIASYPPQRASIA